MKNKIKIKKIPQKVNTKEPNITNYIFSSEKLPMEFDGFKIMHLSDLHSEIYTKLSNIVKIQNPDIICMTGDMVNDNDKYDPFLDLLSSLKDIAPVYLVSGNHEVWRGDYLTYTKKCDEIGCKWLHDESVFIERGNKKIQISGIEDPFSTVGETIDKRINTSLLSIPRSDDFNILLFHRANQFEKVKDKGFDLVLSGHMHGGQIRLPIVGGMVSPKTNFNDNTRVFFPKYSGGMYNIENTALIVSKGLGNPTHLPRIFNTPEICIINLKCDQNNTNRKENTMNYTVEVNEKNIDVFEENIYARPYNEYSKMECVSFTMDSHADIKIKSKIEVKSVTVRPLSAGIKAVVNNNVIEISIDKPQKFSVEINDGIENNLAVFAEADNYNDFDTENENVIYFKKGFHEKDILRITKNNTVLYLEKGATLCGKVLIENCSNVTVCGYGKITMEGIDRNVQPPERQRALEIIGCKNVNVSDIMITDSANWSFRVMGSENLNIDNIKIIGSRGNSDGIDICGSKNVTVQNIFTRTWDDSFVAKAFDTGDLENITYKNSILWNDFARPIEVGVEIRADNARNITFDNIDIIHSTTGYPILGIHHGDHAKVRNVTFSNIRIEDTPGAQIFDIRVTNSAWNRDSEMGDVSDVTFKNINFVGKPGIEYSLSKSRIQGFDEEHKIKNVMFDNFCLLGKACKNADEAGIIIMDHVENVTFKYPENVPTITPVKSSLEICEDFKPDKNGTYKGSVKLTLENLSDTKTNGNAWIQVSPVNTANISDSIFKYDLKAFEKTEKIYDISLPAGKYMISVQSDDIDINCDWLFIELDLNLCDDIMQTFNFKNYYNTKTDDIKIGVKDNKLILDTDILKDIKNSITVYTAMPVEDEDGQVKFTVEETDFGESSAVLLGKYGLELAPQLRCPAEITYVFKNEPKVKEIIKTDICGGKNGAVEIPFDTLGVNGNNFWLEIEAKIPETKKYRYPFTLFHSVQPEKLAHMFVNVNITTSK